MLQRWHIFMILLASQLMTSYFIFTALAVYVLAYSITNLDGPFDAFSRLRYLARKQDTWVKRGIHCPMCVSFWLGWLFALALPYQDYVQYAILALALMGVTVILTQVLDR
jgi:hypothetical protein